MALYLSPPPIRALSQSSTIVILAASRVLQIVTNVKNKSTGNLSLLTILLNTAGNAIRIFTTVTLTGDVLILTTCGIQLCLCLILTGQIIASRRRITDCMYASVPGDGDGSEGSMRK